MTPENEVLLPPTAERVGRELSRWFDHSELSTRPKEPAVPQDPAQACDWVRITPFLVMHAACLAVIWVGFSWVALAVTLGPVPGAHVRDHGLLSPLFLSPHLQDLARRAVHFWLAWRLGRAARTDLVGRASPPSSRALRQAGGRALAGATRVLRSHMGWFMSHKHFAADLSRVKDLLKYPELRFLDRFDIAVPTVLGVGVFLLGFRSSTSHPGLHTSGWQMLVWGFFVSTVRCTTARTPSTRSRTCSAASATRPATAAATTCGSRSSPSARAGTTTTTITRPRCARASTGGNSI